MSASAMLQRCYLIRESHVDLSAQLMCRGAIINDNNSEPTGQSKPKLKPNFKPKPKSKLEFEPELKLELELKPKPKLKLELLDTFFLWLAPRFIRNPKSSIKAATVE